MADNIILEPQETCKTTEAAVSQEITSKTQLKVGESKRNKSKESGPEQNSPTSFIRSQMEESSQKDREGTTTKNSSAKRRQSECNRENDDRLKEAERDPLKLPTDDKKEESDSCFNLSDIKDNCPAIKENDKVRIRDKHKNKKQSSGSDPPSTIITDQPPKKRTTVIQNKDDISAPPDPSDMVLKSQQSLQFWVKKFSSILIDHLNKFGVCVIDNFIGEDRGTRILNEVLELHQTTPFKMGTLSQDLSNQSVRSDQISWIDAIHPPCPAIRSLLNLLDAIVLMANKAPDNAELGKYKISGRTKAMVACYPGRGSHYVRHVDNPNNDGRCITAIYYLNKNWIKEYGGTLMMYPSKPVGSVLASDPIFDRVIFFWSDRRNPHEVLPAYRPRYAITAWYFDSEEKNEYMKRQENAAQK